MRKWWRLAEVRVADEDEDNPCSLFDWIGLDGGIANQGVIRAADDGFQLAITEPVGVAVVPTGDRTLLEAVGLF